MGVSRFLVVTVIVLALGCAGWLVYLMYTQTSVPVDGQGATLAANPSPTITTTPLPTPTLTPSPTPADTPTPTPSPTPSPFSLSAVHAAIQNVVSAHPELTIGVSFINVNDGSRTDVGGSRVFTAASTTKVFIACLALHQIERGAFSLSDSVEGLSVEQRLRSMINQSNNDSWMDLMQFIGYGKQEPYAASIGVTSYDYNNNRITPDDAALILYKLYTGQLLNKEHTNLLLSYMQRTNMEELIPPAVPAGVTFYHKYGDFEVGLHDTAIIDDGHLPFVLTIYTDGDENYVDRYPVFHQIVQAVEEVVRHT